MMILAILMGLIMLGVVGYLIGAYNNFVSLRAGIDSSWSDIDVQLKRRDNLIPALVETIKSYMKYEKESLTELINQIHQTKQSSNLNDIVLHESQLNQSLSRVFALSQNYPELKADTTFINLQTQLSTIESDLQNARRYYNAIARDYNAKIDSFPDMFIAKEFGFTHANYFDIDEDIEKRILKVEL
ncbi:MAG: LemA family protein [Sulfurovum sp.]|nr:MAG: LemA family protein [Sulfurovum sp.]